MTDERDPRLNPLTHDEKEELFKVAEAQKAAPPQPKEIKRRLIGGPHNGKDCIIPENVPTNDVGWWLYHYKVQPNGTMLWSKKEEVWADV